MGDSPVDDCGYGLTWSEPVNRPSVCRLQQTLASSALHILSVMNTYLRVRKKQTAELSGQGKGDHIIGDR
ncbi:MAG: hypothetical protein ACJAUP_003465 [Cellvibrionaceae bacterium]